MSLLRSNLWPGITLAAHTACVAAAAFAIAASIHSKPAEESALLWFLFLAIDFPASCFYDFFSRVEWVRSAVTEHGRMAKEVYFPATFFACVGGCQYFCVAHIIQYLIGVSRARAKRECPEASCAKTQL
jgi:hypothetical protein